MIKIDRLMNIKRTKHSSINQSGINRDSLETNKICARKKPRLLALKCDFLLLKSISYTNRLTDCGERAFNACPSRLLTLAVILSRSLCKFCTVVVICEKNSAVFLSSFFSLDRPRSGLVSSPTTWPLVTTFVSSEGFSLGVIACPFILLCELFNGDDCCCCCDALEYLDPSLIDRSGAD